MKKFLLLPILFFCILFTGNVSAQNYAEIDPSFAIGTGFGNTVMDMALQPDGKIVAGGLFTTYKGLTRNRIARLNADGSYDASFSTGTGFDNVVYAVALQADGKIVVGGDFTTYNNIPCEGIVRLNTDGSIDTSFVIGTGFGHLGFTGMSFINTLAIQPDGKIVAAGRFSAYNGTGQRNIARLNPDGSPDASFNSGSGFNFDVKSLALQADGKIVAGGSFSTYGPGNRKYITRINANGTLDTSFTVGTGFGGSLANNFVNAVAVQPDGKILVGGYFTTYNGTTQNRIARLNTDGSVDASFASASGFDNYFVNTFALQPDGKILVGGGFLYYNGISRRCMARLNANGTLDTSFDIGTGFVGTISNVETILLQPDGKMVVGGWFTSYKTVDQWHITRLNTAGTLSVTDADIRKQEGIALYPNPVKQTLYFSEEVSGVRITDLSGKTVARPSGTVTSVETASLEKGVYVVTAITRTGKTVSSKIVKE